MAHRKYTASSALAQLREHTTCVEFHDNGFWRPGYMFEMCMDLLNSGGVRFPGSLNH